MKRLTLALLFAVAVTGWARAAVELSALTQEMLEDWLGRWPLQSDEQSLDQLDDMISAGAKGIPFDVVMMLDELNFWIASPRDIETFRAWDHDDDVVKTLVPLATSPSDRSLRVPATLILGNVVDNTNVCYVVAHLREHQADISPSGRVNLLQVVLQVAAYAHEDTGKWIEDLALEMIEQASGKDTLQTREILVDLLVALTERRQGRGSDLATEAPQKFEACARRLDLPMIPGNESGTATPTVEVPETTLAPVATAPG